VEQQFRLDILWLLFSCLSLGCCLGGCICCCWCCGLSVFLCRGFRLFDCGLGLRSLTSQTIASPPIHCATGLGSRHWPWPRAHSVESAPRQSSRASLATTGSQHS